MVWQTSDIPDQSGRIALVTGANSGIGEPTARELARAGAHVVLACRSVDKAEAAVQRIGAAVPGASLSVLPLNLADLSSVASCAAAFKAQHDRLDLLINNAGVMTPPYSKTVDGFELQMGTNHLGHFALTAHLFDRWSATAGSRVVTVASIAHRFGTINFDDMHHEQSYNAWRAYGQSKVANLLFTFELKRRLEALKQGTLAVAAHPGWSHTNLVQNSFFMTRWLSPILAQSPVRGAAPTLRAATDMDAKAGAYYGPSGLGGTRGHPVVAKTHQYACRLDIAAQLWAASERLTGARLL